jgi:protein TonB
MLAYAAHAPRTAERRSSPNALLAIIAGHVALAAVVMSARMDLPVRLLDPPIKIIRLHPIDPPPPPNPIRHPQSHPLPGPTVADPRTPLPPLPGPIALPDPGPVDHGPTTGPTGFPNPDPVSLPKAPVRISAQLLTPSSDLRPPYPPAKLIAEEEALLKLRLTIDEHGRVIAVDPVGRTDPTFLAAARRHILAHWRYKPANEDGRAVVSTAVITLRFQLDG